MRLGEIARLIGVVPNRCWRKQRWPSEGAAKAHLRALLRAPFVKDAARLNVYLCSHCGWYHVGRGGAHGG
jgi:hypothetical protein